jgi:serine/threonine-protein kinase RsbW
VSSNGHFKRDVDALPRVFEFTGAFAAQSALDESVVFAMNLAVEELFTNIIKYGASNDRDVGIELDVHDGFLVIEVIDEDTEPFDITAAEKVDVNKRLDEREAGGLGIHLIRSMMDYIKYEYSDRTARITLKKRLEG